MGKKKGCIQKNFDKGGLGWQKGNGGCTKEDFGRRGLSWENGNGGYTLKDFAIGGLSDKVEMEGVFWRVLAKEV
jgi:hypothetical protein